jgi:ring-1,2-phenylacetyl-CoA epoxidase subunit PaaC
MAWLTRLAQSQYTPLAEAAAKMRPEEIYHHRHTSAWLKRLGLGTEESHRRTQAALAQLWSPAQQLFVPLPDESLLVAAGYAPEPLAVKEAWEEEIRPFLIACNLQIPANDAPPTTRRDDHSPHLAALLTDMQEVARLDPQAEW